jgi:hypothetical protein
MRTAASLLTVGSLLLNIVVLVPVCYGLATNAAWTIASYGIATPARAILLSVYVAILVGSVVLLLREPRLVAVLLGLQILYKLTTLLTVGTLNNPVVMSNLGIAAVHMITLASIALSLRR